MRLNVVACSIIRPWAAPLIHMIPQRIMMEIVLTGKPISAQRAYEIGLVNRLVAPDQLMQVAARERDPRLDEGPDDASRRDRVRNAVRGRDDVPPASAIGRHPDEGDDDRPLRLRRLRAQDGDFRKGSSPVAPVPGPRDDVQRGSQERLDETAMLGEEPLANRHLSPR